MKPLVRRCAICLAMIMLVFLLALEAAPGTTACLLWGAC